MARKNMVATRRAEISQAFYRCIVKQGYANTTVRDIAREANLQSGLIHYYFESKDEILLTMCKGIGERYEQIILTLLQRHRNKLPQERLRLGIKFFFTRVSGDRDLTKAFFELQSLAHHDEKIRQILRKLYKEYRRLIADSISECLKEPDMQSLQVKDLAAFMVSAFEGACVLRFTDPRGISLSKLSQVAAQLLDIYIDAAQR